MQQRRDHDLTAIGFITWPSGPRPTDADIRAAVASIDTPALIVFPEGASEPVGYQDWRNWALAPHEWRAFLTDLASETGHSFLTGTIEVVDGCRRNCSRLVSADDSVVVHLKTVSDQPDEAFIAAKPGALLDGNPVFHRGVWIASVVCVEYNEEVWIHLQQRLAAMDDRQHPTAIGIPAALPQNIVTTRSPLTWPLLRQPVVLANAHPDGLDSFIAHADGRWVRQASAHRLYIEVASLEEVTGDPRPRITAAPNDPDPCPRCHRPGTTP